MSQAGKLEGRAVSILKCPCAAGAHLEEHWGCLFIHADGTPRAGHRSGCQAWECPLGPASQLAPTSGASSGLSAPFCLLHSWLLLGRLHPELHPGPPLSPVCPPSATGALVPMVAVGWSGVRKYPWVARDLGPHPGSPTTHLSGPQFPPQPCKHLLVP